MIFAIFYRSPSTKAMMQITAYGWIDAYKIWAVALDRDKNAAIYLDGFNITRDAKTC